MSPSSSGSDHEGDALLEMSDMSHVGAARRRALHIAKCNGFDENAGGQVALVVTEAASNIIKHATRGEILLRSLRLGSSHGFELIALDQGPGIADPERCFRDGFSTAGTPGTGLGAIRRISSFLDMYSRTGKGTALVSRLWADHSRPASLPWEVGAICVAKAGEAVVGDAWAVEPTPAGLCAFVADGLGHGDLAAKAAQAAVQTFRGRIAASPVGASAVAIAQAIHGSLRSTRGAAIAIAAIDFAARRLHYVGIGNISGVLLTGGHCQHLVSHNGTAGAEARKFQEFTYAFPRDAWLIMHSDGVATHWKLDAYPGILQRDPAIVAGVLHRDFTRRRDDSTVLALRESAVEPS